MKLLSIIQKTWGPPHEWEWHELLPLERVTAIDGTVLCGDVMRRKVNDQWQYRAMTEGDRERRASDLAW